MLNKTLAFSSLCDSLEFFDSQKILNSSVEGISVSHLKKSLEKVCNKTKELIRKEIKDNRPVFACLNSDIWSSLKKDKILGISITYIMKEQD